VASARPQRGSSECWPFFLALTDAAAHHAQPLAKSSSPWSISAAETITTSLI
jgi:hypothetical protein